MRFDFGDASLSMTSFIIWWFSSAVRAKPQNRRGKQTKWTKILL